MATYNKFISQQVFHISKVNLSVFPWLSVHSKKRWLEYVLQENTISVFNFMCCLPHLCNYLQNVLAVSEWKLFLHQCLFQHTSDLTLSFKPTVSLTTLGTQSHKLNLVPSTLLLLEKKWSKDCKPSEWNSRQQGMINYFNSVWLNQNFPHRHNKLPVRLAARDGKRIQKT